MIRELKMEFQTDHLLSTHMLELCKFASENCEVWYGGTLSDGFEECVLEDITKHINDGSDFRISIKDEHISMGFNEGDIFCWFFLDKEYISNIASLV
jgi:hypothetical protein